MCLRISKDLEWLEQSRWGGSGPCMWLPWSGPRAYRININSLAVNYLDLFSGSLGLPCWCAWPGSLLATI